MRIITWNCKGAFHLKHDFVAALNPDILIVPECQKITGLSRPLGSSPMRSFEWFGDDPRKGLGVLSYGKYSVSVHPDYDARHRWIVPLIVSGPVSFLLFAVWTLPLGSQGGRYVRPLFEAFEFYKPMIDGSNVIWAGDFNSSHVFDTPSRPYKFRDFVKLLGELNLRSVYHQHTGHFHGEEAHETFYLYHHEEKGFHIDYVFASAGLSAHGVDVSVGSHADWAKRSDHAPLICDFLEPSIVDLKAL